MSADWVIRPAVPEDESCIASMWLRGLSYSQCARGAGFPRSTDRDSADHVAWWALNQPIVTGLVRSAQVRVLCDPDRAGYEPGSPAVIWGWAVFGGENVVYGCGVKKSVRAVSRAMASDIVGALFGERLQRPQIEAMDLVDLRHMGLVPEAWSNDFNWWRAMRCLVDRRIDSDEVSRKTVAHIFDPEREQWLPNSMRAA